VTSIKKKASATTVATKPMAVAHDAADMPVRKKTKAREMADLALQPTFNAAAVAINYISAPGGELSVVDLMESLKDSIDEVRAGDMRHAEAMLFSQAHALQAIFLDMALRAAKNSQPEHREASLRLALKAQNQSRMTLETLATIKNPPVVIARQANISSGPQQVNNGVASVHADRAHAENQRRRPNELIEESDEQGLDAGTARSPGGANSCLETVGQGYRAAHC